MLNNLRSISFVALSWRALISRRGKYWNVHKCNVLSRVGFHIRCTFKDAQGERIDIEDEDIMNVMSDQHWMQRGKFAEELILGGDDMIVNI